MIRPYFSRTYIRPRGWAPYYPFRFGRPYYEFSPWLSLGFGLSVGYPVPYPWVSLGSYQPTVFGVDVGGGYQAVPGASTYDGPVTSVGADTYGDATTNGGAPAYGGVNTNNGATTNGAAITNGNANSYGGASFDIQPADANLFVDGQYVGVVGSFGPSSEPLTLEPGQHRIAIQKDGYRPMEWDVTIEAGQVMPYRGALERQ